MGTRLSILPTTDLEEGAIINGVLVTDLEEGAIINGVLVVEDEIQWGRAQGLCVVKISKEMPCYLGDFLDEK